MHLRFLPSVFLLLLLAHTSTFAQRPELIVQTGDPDGPNVAAFSPDGRTIVGGGNGEGQPLRFWSVATGAPLPSSVVPSGMVHTLAYSPDGRFIASDDRNTIKLWDARTKRILRTLTRDVDSFHIVVFSPDSRTLASQAPTKTDRLVDLWDVATGRLLRELPGNIP